MIPGFLGRDPIYRVLDLVGDGTGEKNAAIDGTIPKVFKIMGKLFIYRMLVYLKDQTDFWTETYGGRSALTNGLLVQKRLISDDSVIVDYLDGLPIKSNPDWGRVCYDTVPDELRAGQRHLKVRWSFYKSGQPISLSKEEYFCVVIQDDLTPLAEHYFSVQGVGC